MIDFDIPQSIQKQVLSTLESLQVALDLWIPVLAVAILLAVVVPTALAVWNRIEARQYYRLSLRPYLYVWFDDETDSIRSEKTRVTCLVQNNGLGPAIMQDWALYFEDRPFRFHDEAEYVRFLDEKCKAEGCVLIGAHFFDLSSQASLATNGGVELFSFEGSPRKVATLKTKMRIEVLYQSVYGKGYSA